VNAAVPDGGDGVTWSTAFNDLQSALAVATTGDRGGGILIEDAEVHIVGCMFAENAASDGGGGAVYCDQGTLVIEDCEFHSNAAVRSDGGAILSEESFLSVVDSQFELNSTTYESFAGFGGSRWRWRQRILRIRHLTD
jgi:hypothetical protein